MSLKILCAGCSKDERELAEAEVKRALADRSATHAWTVSLVKMQGRWSVTLDAPSAQLRGLTVAAPEGRLAESIREALRVGAPFAPAAKPAPNPPFAPVVEAGGRQRCEKCGGAFVVQYDSRPGEPVASAPVACPRCWHINRVQIGAEAAFNKDYRAEKV